MSNGAAQNPFGSASGRPRVVITARLDACGKRGQDVTADADHNVLTTRVVLGFIVFALLLCARPAAACPASANPCMKYKMRVVRVEPLYYKRDAAAPMPKFSEKNVTRFLMTSLWTPVFPEKVPLRPAQPYGERMQIDTRKVRFVDPDHIPAAPPNTRDAFAGHIMQSDGFTYVDVYGQTFWLTTCAKDKKRACLEPLPAPPAP